MIAAAHDSLRELCARQNPAYMAHPPIFNSLQASSIRYGLGCARKRTYKSGWFKLRENKQSLTLAVVQMAVSEFPSDQTSRSYLTLSRHKSAEAHFLCSRPTLFRIRTSVPPCSKETSSMASFIKWMPRPCSDLRFSTARGSGTISGSNPSP